MKSFNVFLSSDDAGFLRKTRPQLEDGARVAVMGGGPAGSLFSYFLLDIAERAGLSLHLDIYEPRDFSQFGPTGCNMCAGIISESLVQMLAVEGINLPPNVVQRGIDTYVLHTTAGNVRLTTPDAEKRIATIFRGSGPTGTKDSQWRSFDGFLLEQAVEKGAHLIPARIDDVSRTSNAIRVRARGGPEQDYSFLAVGVGVNTNSLRLFEPLDIGYRPPAMMQTYIREYFLGRDVIDRYLGQHAVHFFLLDLPKVDFAAVAPKGDYATLCILGRNLTKEDVTSFLNSRELHAAMPPGWDAAQPACQCAPRINVAAAVHPFSDRIVFLGDSGVSRLYKDGIGAAYRAAKAAASTAIFHGIGQEDFETHYWHYCQTVDRDNRIGKGVFALVTQLRPRKFAVKALLRMAAHEQDYHGLPRMSSIMWDTFTGSAPYLDIFLRFLPPAFWGRYLWHVGASLAGRA